MSNIQSKGPRNINILARRTIILENAPLLSPQRITGPCAPLFKTQKHPSRPLQATPRSSFEGVRSDHGQFSDQVQLNLKDEQQSRKEIVQMYAIFARTTALHIIGTVNITTVEGCTDFVSPRKIKYLPSRKMVHIVDPEER